MSDVDDRFDVEPVLTQAVDDINALFVFNVDVEPAAAMPLVDVGAPFLNTVVSVDVESALVV